MSRRIEKISDLIMKELGLVIQTEIRDPRIGFVTLSRVDVSHDLSVANVYVSVLGDDKQQKDSIIGLASSAAYLRRHLSKSLSTRTVPKLNFILDQGLENSQRIQNILSDLDEADDQ